MITANPFFFTLVTFTRTQIVGIKVPIRLEMLNVNTSTGRFQSGTLGNKNHAVRKGWFMPIIIPNCVHDHIRSDTVLSCACVLRLHNTFLSLHQPIIFRLAVI